MYAKLKSLAQNLNLHSLTFDLFYQFGAFDLLEK